MVNKYNLYEVRLTIEMMGYWSRLGKLNRWQYKKVVPQTIFLNYIFGRCVLFATKVHIENISFELSLGYV